MISIPVITGAFVIAITMTSCCGDSVPMTPPIPPTSTIQVTAVPDAVKMTVTRVIDGDTVDVSSGGGATERVRILGIDTPEVYGGVECWGPEASRFATATLLDREVTIEYDPTQGRRDQFGRVIAYVILADGADYSTLAAREGTARSYVFRKPVQRHDQIVTAELQAMQERRGLWGSCPRENER